MPYGTYGSILKPNQDPSMVQSLLGYTTQADNGALASNSGLLNPIVSALGTGIGLYQGFKQLGIAEDDLAFRKDSWKKNFAMMQDQYNRQLNDRRASRLINYGTTQAEAMDIVNHFDSGTPVNGAYVPKNYGDRQQVSAFATDASWHGPQDQIPEANREFSRNQIANQAVPAKSAFADNPSQEQLSSIRTDGKPIRREKLNSPAKVKKKKKENPKDNIV